MQRYVVGMTRTRLYTTLEPTYVGEATFEDPVANSMAGSEGGENGI
jgi:hypothetical protein